MFERGLLREPNLYLSERIEAHRDQYVGLLNALGRTKTAWTAWVRFLLLAVERQMQQNARKARATLQLYGELKGRFLEVTRSQFAVPLLDFIFSAPIFQPGQLRWATAAPSRPQLTTMLLNLHKAGVLAMVRKGTGKRPSIWSLTSLIALAEKRFVTSEED